MPCRAGGAPGACGAALPEVTASVYFEYFQLYVHCGDLARALHVQLILGGLCNVRRRCQGQRKCGFFPV